MVFPNEKTVWLATSPENYFYAAPAGRQPAHALRQRDALTGHKSPNITMQIYTHANTESKCKAMDAMQAAYIQACLATSEGVTRA